MKGDKQIKSPLLADFFLRFIFCLPIWSLAQQNQQLWGVVRDKETGSPLSFARVWTAQSKAGTYSDLDGKFSFARSQESDTLRVSYVGYVPYSIPVSEFRNGSHILMVPKETRVGEIVIVPEDNPAELVMRRAIEQRSWNDFNRLPAWKYDSYNKLFIFPKTLNPDGTVSEAERARRDSMVHEIDSLAEVMHLFLWESVTRKEYRRPGKSKEVIIASRSSGFKESVLPLVPADIIDFSSFYKDWVSVLGQSFLSPLNPEALSKYRFTMRDTIPDGLDTLYAIDFSPAKKSFNGFEGTLHIHSGRYALQHIKADLFIQEQDQVINGGRVEQLFQLLQDSVWFPSQLLTEFEVGTGALADDVSGLLRLNMAARVYLSNISLDPDSVTRRFGPDAIVTEVQAAHRDSAFWKQFRADTLDAREKNTYQFIDSLGGKFRFDSWAYQGQKLAAGKIAWKRLDIDLSRILQYNLVEKLRVGIGLETNEKLSATFSLGGWAGWSWADQTMKYGGFARLHPFADKRWQAEYRYEYDLLESGAPGLLMNGYQRTADLLGRNVRMRIMDYQTSRKWILRNPVMKNWTQELSFTQTDVQPAYTYLFQGASRYFLNEWAWEHRIAPGEKFLKNGPFRIRLGTPLPVFRFRVFASREWPDGLGLNYSGASASVVHTLNLHTRGKFQYALQGNYSEGALPYARLQVLRGNDDKSWPLTAPMSFNTMRFNEFVADRSLLVHVRYDFNNALFHSRKWHPNLLLEYNLGWGILDSGTAWQVTPFPIQAPENIFQETGIILQDILPRQWVRKSPTLALIGLGCYYRIGAYTLPEPIDNFSFKLYSGFKF